MLHFHFIPNASFFIAFLGHTHMHTHTHTYTYANGSHHTGTRASQFAALGSTVRFALRSERNFARAQESAQHHNCTAWATEHRTKAKRNETKRDENTIRDTRNVKRENETQRTAPFAVAFVRLLQYLFVACRVLKEAAGANSVQCRQFRFN